MQYKSNCLTYQKFEYCWFNGEDVRLLTPIECERLQTVPENYTQIAPTSKRYSMLGNGWTVDAVAEFLKHIPKDLDLF